MINHFLLISILFPILAAVLLPFFSYKNRSEKSEKAFSFFVSIFSGIALLFSWLNGSRKLGFFENKESYLWLPDFSIQLDLGVDGLSAPFALVFCLIFPFFIFFESSKGYRHRLNLIMLLLCQSFSLGLVLSLDLFFIFLFWSAITLPVYFIMTFGSADGDGNRTGFKFIVFSWLSNALLFLSFTMIYFLSSPYSFSLESLMGGLRAGEEFGFMGFSLKLNHLAFFLFLGSVFCRIPSFLTSSWFSHLFSHTSYLVMGIISAVIVPLSLYVFLKIGFLIFPIEIKQWAVFLFYISMLGFVLGALSTLVGVEIKKSLSYFLLANTSVCLLGLTSLDSYGTAGGVYHLFSMSIVFSGVAMLMYVFLDKTRMFNNVENSNEKISDGRGAVVFFSLFILIFSLFFGPGTISFVSFSQVIIGSYASGLIFPLFLLLGVFVMSISGFNFFKSVSELSTRENTGTLGFLERLIFIPLVVSCIFFGLYPKILMDFIRPVALTILSIVK